MFALNPKAFFCAALLLATAAQAAPAKKIKPSSDIPIRREFPVSESADPCNNFYEYACSEVNKTFKLRPDRSKHTFAFNDSAERLLTAKTNYLKKITSQKDGLSSRATELRDIYKSCMNANARKKEEREIVKNLQKELSAIHDKNDFLAFNASKLLTADYSFLSFGDVPNQDKPLRNDIYLLATLQNLPERSYYDRPEVLKAYTDVVEVYLKHLGVKDPKTQAKKIVDFEKEFAQSFPLPAEFRQLFSTRTSITKKELIEKYPQFQLSEFLNEIPDDTLIRNFSPVNFEKLNESLEKTDLATLKDLYLLHAAQGSMDDAYPEAYKKNFDFEHKYLGSPEKRPVREERCTKLVMGKFAKEIDAELLPVLFQDFPREKFIALADRVRGAIIEGMENNKWLSSSARRAAIDKMKNAKLHLVSPNTEADWNFNPPANYSAEHFYQNLKVLNENLIKKTLAELKTDRNLNQWDMGPLTVNAYYSPSDNKFVMPIGILQYPFYDPNLSDEANLGAVGAVIGHELGHGVDDMGAKFDSDGKLKQWMSMKDLAEFHKRGEQLVAQFNAIGHNGQLTLGENIGDLVGLTFAYRAAFKDKKPTPEQQRALFTQYARVWCYEARPEYEKMLLKTDPHSLGTARVNEQMKHQPGFAEAFSCKPGSKMTLPADQRVVIW